MAAIGFNVEAIREGLVRKRDIREKVENLHKLIYILAVHESRCALFSQIAPSAI